MHVDSPAFWALSDWLDYIEKTLNPYKKFVFILYFQKEINFFAVQKL
jgi:hypothetical protein